jgi:hypothetical protein
MRAHVIAVVLVLSSVAACGGDDEVVADGGGDFDASVGPDGAVECVDPAAHTAPEGVFATPADLDRTGCEPGTLTGFDPTGLWYIKHEPHPRWRRGPVTFALTCEDGLRADLSTIAGTTEVGHQFLDADHLFLRNERSFGESFSQIEVYDVCKLNVDGSVFGKFGSCFVGDFGESCSESDFTARPFGRIDGESEADGLVLVSEWSGGAAPWPDDFTADVRVRDGIAYIARGGDGIRIVDVSDPANPSDLGFFESQSDNYNELKVVEGPTGKPYLLVASAASGIFVLDVDDPTKPTMVTRFSPFNDPEWGVHTLYTEVVGATSYAYLADGFSDNVFVYDVTDPENPSNVGTYNLGNEDWGVHAVSVDQGRAYINATVGGLIIADLLPDPSAATAVGRYAKENLYAHQSWNTTAGGRKVALHGDEGFGSHLEVVDVDEASGEFMQRIGEYELRPEVSIHDVMALGEKGYVAHYQDGIRVFDLSDPTNPTQSAYFNTWSPQNAPGAQLEGAVGMDVDLGAGLIYVADTPRGLLILRETN